MPRMILTSLGLRKTPKITGCLVQKVRVVLEMSDGHIARMAQGSSYCASSMAVVNHHLSGLKESADSAGRRPHLLSLFERHPVFLANVLGAGAGPAESTQPIRDTVGDSKLGHGEVVEAVRAEAVSLIVVAGHPPGTVRLSKRWGARVTGVALPVSPCCDALAPFDLAYSIGLSPPICKDACFAPTAASVGGRRLSVKVA